MYHYLRKGGMYIASYKPLSYNSSQAIIIGAHFLWLGSFLGTVSVGLR